MSSQDLIRLRVSVQRHGVPEVKLVWPCARSQDLTVSKFLSQVNEVMPLESGEWGLEDYVVELADGAGGSYECLHFQPIPHILKNDDHVLIRCLHGEDLKRRRLSGRHQISADGRHLVDGLVFGRPWLRTPRDRPALELPPRKRARIARDGGSSDDFDDQDEAPPPRLLPERAQQDLGDDEELAEGSDDSDEWQEAEHDEGSDEELDDVRGEDQDELDEELRYLEQEDMTVEHHTPANNQETSNQAIGARAPTTGGLDLGALDGIVALRAAFPSAPVVAIEAELLERHKDLSKTYDALSSSYEPTMSFDEMMEKAVIKLLFSGQASSSERPADSLAHQRSRTPRPLIQVVESNDRPEDAAAALAYVPPNVDREQGRHDVNLQQPWPASREDEDTVVRDTAGDMDDSDETSADDTDSSSSSASSSNDDESSSEGSNGDSDFSDAGHGAPIDGQPSDDESSSENSESDSDGSDSDASDSDSDSDDSDDSVSDSESESDSDSDSDSRDDDSGTSVDEQATQKTGLKGSQGAAEASSGTFGAPAGRTKTQKRNARRRRSMARALAENRRQLDDEAFTFEVRKQQLLRKLDENAEVTGQDQAVQAERILTNPDDDGAEQAKNGGEASTAPDRPRSRFDVDAGRRLLFGSLGLKAPKTRADAEKIKQRLMKDVRPLNNMRLVEGEKADEGPAAGAGDDADDWRQHVTYRAVECSQPGMVLSEPPFPFEQRWDPQQRGKACRKRKRTSQEFSQDYYGDDDSGLYLEEDVGQTKRARNLAGDPFGPDTAGEESAGGKTPSSETEGRNGAGQADDVPPLPAEIGSLADLGAGEAKEGMVITWKQMTVSKATRWQPTVVQQTATVLSGSDDTILHVLLAARDREDKTRTYDEAGQRIYDKFEMPDEDSDDEGGDDGERILAWAEMTEPKIVRMPGEKQQG